MKLTVMVKRRISKYTRLTSLVIWLVTAVAFRLLNVLGMEPNFDVPIVNVTVVAGQTAVLPCSIEHLGKFKVAWLDHSSIPLTYEDRRVVDDTRFSVVRPGMREWNLQVRDVKWEDQGQYRCTINTNPVKSKIIMLHVKVPATILDEFSSDDVTVQEGDTIVLICNVTGVPQPEVTWYKKPAASKNSERERIGMAGEMIIIRNVSRYCDDIYECVATNGVPPAVSRQMRVTVEFAPEITMNNRRMGQARGKETILECVITAFPQVVNYWEKDGRRITSSSTKHRVEAYDDGDHSLVLSLRISEIDQSDYGEYKCVASNPLGIDQETMYLYEYTEPEDRFKSTEHLDIHWSTWFTNRPIYSIPIDRFTGKNTDIKSNRPTGGTIVRYNNNNNNNNFKTHEQPISDRVQNGSRELNRCHHVTFLACCLTSYYYVVFFLAFMRRTMMTSL